MAPLASVGMAENLARIGSNVATTMAQDISTMKSGAAFWSTFVHVLLRCGVAIQSSRTAPPDDLYFTKRQSAEVLFRELVGFSLGFGVVKQLDGILKGRVRKWANYDIERPGTTGLVKGVKEAVGVLTGRVKEVKKSPAVMTGETVVKKIGDTPEFFTKVGRWAQKTLPETVSKIPKDVVDPAQLEKMGFKFAHTWLPVAIGSIPAIYISGWLLERSTLLHGERIVDIITGEAEKFKKLTHRKGSVGPEEGKEAGKNTVPHRLRPHLSLRKMPAPKAPPHVEAVSQVVGQLHQQLVPGAFPLGNPVRDGSSTLGVTMPNGSVFTAPAQTSMPFTQRPAQTFSANKPVVRQTPPMTGFASPGRLWH